MMKFKSVCIFVTTLACVLNVAFTYVLNLDTSDTISARLKRETFSIDEQRNKCYKEFTLKTDDFLAQVKKRSLDCDHVAESAKCQFDVLNGNAREEFQSLVADKMKSTSADDLQKSSEETSASEYFQCVRSFETAQKEFLDEINLKSGDYLNELEKIEDNRRHCLKQVVDKNKSYSASLSLQQCLDQISEPNLTPTPSSAPMPQLNDEMSENLSKLKNIYQELKSCTENGKVRYLFHDCLQQTNKNLKLELNDLSKHAAEYFPRLNEIDKSEDICLRHLVAQFISGTPYDDEIFNCFEKGRANSSFTGNSGNLNSYKIWLLEELPRSLTDCKYVDSTEKDKCIDNALRRFEFDFLFALDEITENAIANVNVEEDARICLRFALKKLQFNGIFLKNSDKEGFKRCYYNN